MKSIQTILMAKIIYIDGQVQFAIAEHDTYFYGYGEDANTILRGKLRFHLKEVINIERDYSLYPNNKQYLLRLKTKIRLELRKLR